uniref:NADH dehydrogenase subunit 6 n=1 Tax=Plexippus paykulli TaxID=243411 RepID=A0A0U1V5S1_PLEPA|nr:NADH dehydrogenase subunit 6 [Plexippus paykulli]AIM52649.1 NADH dehydrogenase subunit 6 [Plexippus paykulli]
MLVVVLGIFFVSSVQPMFMISSLILIVLMYSYIVYIMIGGYWFSYALMMVMLSGVLVVFTYMVSLIPNESFESYNLMYMMGMLLLLMGGYYILMYDFKGGMLSLSLWMTLVSVFNMFMVSFLLSIMLVVVWLSYMEYGALRN